MTETLCDLSFYNENGYDTVNDFSKLATVDIACDYPKHKRSKLCE